MASINLITFKILCFKEIADYTQSAFVKCLEPVMMSNYSNRGLKPAKAPSHILDTAAEMLILLWIAMMKRLIRPRGPARGGGASETQDIEDLQLGLIDLL